jgi:hypothetical protein
MKENADVFKNKNMKSFIGYALGQTKKFGIKGARYGELKTFVTYFDKISEKHSYETKMEEVFDELESIVKKENFKYIKFTMALGPKTSNVQKEIPYFTVLGKMFSGSVTVGYFIERVNLLFNQFGNRTKTIANTKSKSDWKAASHSVRIASEVLELLETDKITFPLKNADHIKDIKEGRIDMEQVVNEVQEILEKVDMLMETSDLPKEANKEAINDIILKLIGEV